MARHKPKWATPDCQAHLVRLFLRSGGFCVFGDKPCPYPEHHHYTPFTEGLIADWIADDRAQRQAEIKAEWKALHGLGERGRMRGQFNAISRDIFFAKQPQFYLEGLGISGTTYKPFAKIRLASGFVYLYVDLGDTLKAMSKSQRRKVLRCGKALPWEIQGQVDFLCRLAVKHYLG